MDEPNRKNWLVNVVAAIGAAVLHPPQAVGFILLLCTGMAGAEEKRSPQVGATNQVGGCYKSLQGEQYPISQRAT